MPSRRRFFQHLSSLAAASALAPALWAQPMTKPVRILVGFSPGGSADLIARALSVNLGAYASSVVVENRAGAGGRIALEALKNSEADGSTLAITPASMLVLYPHIYKKLPYETLRDFAPVSTVASAQFAVSVGPMVPATVKTLADFLRWCKANPAQAAYGSSGAGSIPHFTGVALSHASGVELTHAAYKGGGPAINDLLGGQIAANVSVLSNVLPHQQAGKLRVLTVTGLSRSALLPAVPTLAESGIRDVEAVEWFGALLPAKTPPDIVNKLNAALQEALKTRAVQDALAKASFDVSAGETPAAFAQRIKTDLSRWGAIVKSSGFTPED